jgi:hypothetical protein
MRFRYIEHSEAKSSGHNNPQSSCSHGPAAAVNISQWIRSQDVDASGVRYVPPPLVPGATEITRHFGHLQLSWFLPLEDVRAGPCGVGCYGSPEPPLQLRESCHVNQGVWMHSMKIVLANISSARFGSSCNGQYRHFGTMGTVTYWLSDWRSET